MHSNIIETGQPGDDPKAFRRCLGQFATGVTVMTASCNAQLAGMSVNSFAALSMDPPLVLWSIRKESISLPVYRDATHYAVNVLGAHQVDVSARFATPAGDKFAPNDWDCGLGGAPLIRGCIAQFECALEQVIEGGDHYILLGRVERYTRFTGEPLLFAQGRYAAAQDFPAAIPPLSGTERPFAVESASVMRLANYAARQLAEHFNTYREHKGLSIAQIRLLGWLREAHHTLDQLVDLTYLGRQDVCDALQDMLQKGQVQRDADRYALTPNGQSEVEAIALGVADFEKRLFARTPQTEQERIRATLLSLADLAHTP